jgi:hypothetical protein
MSDSHTTAFCAISGTYENSIAKRSENKPNPSQPRTWGSHERVSVDAMCQVCERSRAITGSEARECRDGRAAGRRLLG